MRRLWTLKGWFNGNDGAEAAHVGAEATDKNEVLVEIVSTADWAGHGDDRPRAGAHLNPVDALQLSEDLRSSAIKALGFNVTEKIP